MTPLSARYTLLLLGLSVSCLLAGVVQLCAGADALGAWSLAALLVSGGGLALAWFCVQLTLDLQHGGPGMLRALLPDPVGLVLVLLAVAGGVGTHGWLEEVEGISVARRLDLVDPVAWAAPGLTAYYAPVATMVAGSVLVALGVVATVSLVAGAWALLRVLPGGRRVAPLLTSALLLVGAVPFLIPLLAARLWLGGPALAAASAAVGAPLHLSQTLCGGGGIAAGLLVTAVFLGLRGGGALCSTLDGVEAFEGSDVYRTARAAGMGHLAVVLRRLVWQQHRGEVEGVLIQAATSAVLVDLLGNNLLDIFADRSALAPLYPSLGSVTWLNLYADPVVLQRVAQVHMLAALVAVGLLVPPDAGGGRGPHLSGDQVLRGGATVLRQVPALAGLVLPRQLTWVLGPSGGGKTTWMLAAWGALGDRAVVVPQDPDHALPRELPVTAILRWVFDDELAGARKLLPVLRDMGDEQLANRLRDAFTPTGVFSRGQRQRLAIALALAAAQGRALLLDEATSAQDGERTRRVLAAIRRWVEAGGAGWICTHDPSALRDDLQADDRVCFVGDETVLAIGASEFTALDSRPGDPRARYVAALRQLFSGGGGALPLPNLGRLRVGIAGGAVRRGGCTVRVRGEGAQLSLPFGAVVLLEGPSGGGKSVIMEHLVDRCVEGLSRLGWIAQDPGRAFPQGMPAREVGNREASLFNDLEGTLLRGRLFGSLSEGQRQRLVFGAAMTRVSEAAEEEVAVLFLDEPFGSVDPPTHVELVDLVLTWVGAARGRCAVIVSHHGEYLRARAADLGVPVARWRVNVDVVTDSA